MTKIAAHRKIFSVNSLPADCITQAFDVAFSYPVHFTHDIFNPVNPILAAVCGPQETGCPRRAVIYIDDGVVRATPGILDRIGACFAARPMPRLMIPPEVITGGKQAKHGWHGVQHVITQLGQNRLCRHSYVIAVGGGSLLDMVGFAASLVHRGLRLIRIPTTTLAQDDAGVGIKNGMDEHGLKNFIGTFAPPQAVLIDFDFLRTLDDTHWRGGIAEAFKVALIEDADFFLFLEKNAARLRARQAGVMERLIRRCAILHLDHIRTGGDPFEMGAARPLDFGHWSAHKLEALSGFNIGHGQAVAIGIALDTFYAAAKGFISMAARDRVVQALQRAGLPVWCDLLGARGPGRQLQIIDGLDNFREHLGGRLAITLPDGIGRRIEVHEMDARVIARGVEWLRRRKD